MSYRLDTVAMEVDMSPESMAQVTELWNDIASGKLPLLFTSDGKFIEGASPITEYIDYVGVNSNQPYTMQVRVVESDFFRNLNEKTAAGEFVLFEDSADTIPECSAGAWEKARAQETDGRLRIDYSYAIESTVPPEYTKDGKAHCYLYVRPARD